MHPGSDTFRHRVAGTASNSVVSWRLDIRHILLAIIIINYYNVYLLTYHTWTETWPMMNPLLSKIFDSCRTMLAECTQDPHLHNLASINCPSYSTRLVR